MSDLSPAMLEAEFQTFLARAGMELPAERRDVILTSYADFRAQMDVMHMALDATQEPSNIFRMQGAAR